LNNTQTANQFFLHLQNHEKTHKINSDCYKLAPLLQLPAYCRLLLFQAVHKNHI